MGWWERSEERVPDSDPYFVTFQSKINGIDDSLCISCIWKRAICSRNFLRDILSTRKEFLWISEAFGLNNFSDPLFLNWPRGHTGEYSVPRREFLASKSKPHPHLQYWVRKCLEGPNQQFPSCGSAKAWQPICRFEWRLPAVLTVAGWNRRRQVRWPDKKPPRNANFGPRLFERLNQTFCSANIHIGIMQFKVWFE